MSLIANLGRNETCWEETLYDLTPIDEVNGLRFKREDKYAPLGYGCINGSKLRQLVWLVNTYANTDGSKKGLISGASVHSPQLSMGSAVANHFGIASTHVLGATSPTTAIRHPDVEMATWLGATFEYSKVAYNGALQSKVRELLQTPQYADYFYLEYGVSLDHRSHRAGDIEAFHRIGAEQVRNIPECDTLIVPSGSCNSLVSVLYGIALFEPKIKKLALVEIGPNKRDWVRDRLMAIQAKCSFPVSTILDDGRYEVEYHDLHRSNYVTYGETMNYTHGSIAFHPRYEGKVMTYMADRHPDYLNPDNIIWIVAGEASKEALQSVLSKQGATA
jgi:1-aminocyclopropane-1-carboxylate deaminase/D-cysteine desulfhydrase-like pyridoxal-dependent ACC family enzyme